jgi:predicted RNA-binding Zn-ribbon protein involved in translation (DUF1610 family)
MSRRISDCGNDACGKCAVCRYLDHLEHAFACAPVGESTIGRDAKIETYLDAQYPNWRK